MPKITKRVVDSAAAKKARVYIWDVEIKGFGLLILPSGVKSYVYQYRTPEGRTRRATIGKHSNTFTAEQARKGAQKMQRMVQGGADPLGEKRAAREALTVAEVLDLYLESELFAAKAASTQAIDRGRIARHLKPTLGRKFVSKLTGEDVRRAFSSIRDGKTAVNEKTGHRGRAIVTGGEGAARMSVRLFRAVMRWSIKEGFASHNPADGVEVGVDGSRDVIIEKADDYARLFRTLDKMQNELRLRAPVADAIRVIALTGARRGEVAGLRWAHVDLKGGVIVLPPAEHKTGRKTGAPRIIGLPAAAQAIIARQDQGKPSDYVFAPSKGEGPPDLSHPWRKIREEAGLPATIGLHGLRHSMASHMAMNGAEAAEIMTTLGHRQLSTAQRYIHWAQDGRAALAEKAAAHITGAMNADKKKAKVVRIKRAKS